MPRRYASGRTASTAAFRFVIAIWVYSSSNSSAPPPLIDKERLAGRRQEVEAKNAKRG
jgi:hypothetical protein